MAVADRRHPGLAQPRAPGAVRGGTGLVDGSHPHDALAEVRVPCLVLAFEHDVDSPPRYARQAAEAIPGCDYFEVEGSGHIGILTHADQVAAALVDFFAQH